MTDKLELDHVGYVVADIDQYLEEFFIPLFRPSFVSQVIEDPVQQVRVALVTLWAGGRIELIQPTDEASPVNRILKDKRGGLYHLCYSVKHLEPAVARFRQKGSLLISGPTPAAAFDGRRIAFLYTPQFDVIELVEEKEGGSENE